ncbi:MAG: hypothetical protein JWO05_1443 [Gemmatimonadetes bacterium]|nr:hypothetical protein [Gemmatimonadota bacterium]
MAVVILAREVVPEGMVRVLERMRTIALVVGLLLLPLIGGWLGYLEGKLKLD